MLDFTALICYKIIGSYSNNLPTSYSQCYCAFYPITNCEKSSTGSIWVSSRRVSDPSIKIIGFLIFSAKVWGVRFVFWNLRLLLVCSREMWNISRAKRAIGERKAQNAVLHSCALKVCKQVSSRNVIHQFLIINDFSIALIIVFEVEGGGEPFLKLP